MATENQVYYSLFSFIQTRVHKNVPCSKWQFYLHKVESNRNNLSSKPVDMKQRADLVVVGREMMVIIIVMFYE